MSEYYHILEWDDYGTIEDKLRALYNTHNWLTHEMSIGRVPMNKIELQNNIDSAEARVKTPLSIAFVKMVEKGEIDEITASENADMFIEWDVQSTYAFNDFRCYEGKLYKCLEAHISQADWTPDVTPSLWKVVGINENGIAEWSQPISSADVYMTGDEVMYNNVHYRSLIDNNVWSPEAYPEAWEVVE